MIRQMVNAATKIIDDTRAAISPTYAENRSRLRSEVEAEEKRAHMAMMRAEQRRTDLRNLMSTEWGRRIVWRQLCDLRLQGETWHENPRVSDRMEGQRAYAIAYSRELVNISVELYTKMETEAYQDAQRGA